MGRMIMTRGLIDEDFVNYRLPAMTVMFPRCSFKCGREACQNAAMEGLPIIMADAGGLAERYANNPITKAVVFQGLEPFDTPEDMFGLLESIRERTDDPVVIYTGYTREEVTDSGWLERLAKHRNVIVKYGRYVPGEDPHYDEVLGVALASGNQYAREEGLPDKEGEEGNGDDDDGRN